MAEKYQRGIENIVLPTLNLESESDDDDDIEPIIFHPGLNKEPTKTPDTKDVSTQDSGINVEIQDNVENRKVSMHIETILKDRNQVPYVSQLETIELPEIPDITEIELDNALFEHENGGVNQSHTIHQQEPNSLSDSGSSGSSLMGKLEAVVSSLIDQKHTEDSIFHQVKIPVKPRSPKLKAESRETIVIDLHMETETNRCVTERYSSCAEEDIDRFDLEKQREEIKRQSMEIVQSQQTMSKGQSTENGFENENNVEMKTAYSNIPLQVIQFDSPNEDTPICPTTAVDILSKMTSNTMVESVDQMLEEVNRIMYKISDPGADVSSDLVNQLGDVQSLYDDTLDEEVRVISERKLDFKSKDDCPEVVQEYIVYDQNTGEASSIVHENGCSVIGMGDMQPLTELCGEICKQNTECGSDNEGSSMSIDVDTNVTVVGWDEVLIPEQPAKQSISNNNSPVKPSGDKQVFDSLFTNSFLSANSNFTTNSTKKIEAKPKTNILKSRNSKNQMTSPMVGKTTTDKKDQHNIISESLKEELISFQTELKVNFIHENKNKTNVSNTKVTNRELDFVKKEGDTNKNTMKNDNNQCLACLQLTKDHLETPLKHDSTKNCTHLQDQLITNERKCKQTCSVGVTTSDLCKIDDISARNDVTSTNENENIPTVEQEIIPTKSNKKKKKKKNKPQKEVANEESITSAKEQHGKKTQQQQQQLSGTGSKEKELTINEIHEIEQIIKDIQIETGQLNIMISSDTCFKEKIHLIPPITNKQCLVLKIPLESPGVCKGTGNNDKHNGVVETNQFNNFLGLVALFMFLLQGNASKYQLESLDVPFDVISLFQCSIDDELYLIVGICENDKTYLHKTKRTKLGSNFFHAVSQFIHANSLEKLLSKYLPDIPLFSAFGKLSLFINIVPDENFLQKLTSITPTCFINSISKPLKLSDSIDLEPFPADHKIQHLAMVTLQFNSQFMNLLINFISFFQDKTLEIVGLKIGYVPSDRDPNIQQATLSICTPVSQGCNYFQNCSIKSTSAGDQSPSSCFTLKHNKSQWFGPTFKDVNELKELASTLKSTIKNNASVSKRKKNSADISRLSFLSTTLCHVVFLVSSTVPSWAIPCIIAVSEQAGVAMKNISRNTISAEHLCSFGIFEGNSKHFGSPRWEWKKTEVFFTYLLFYGSNAVIKLKNISEKLTELLNNGVTEDAQIMQCFEKTPSLHSALKKRKYQIGCKLTCKDYFSVLRLNNQSVQLCAKYENVPNPGVLDFYESIVQYCQRIPAVNMVLLVIYGHQLLMQLQKILEVCFLGSTASQQDGRKTLLIQSLIGVKHVKALQRYEAYELINEDINSRQWKQMASCLESQPAVIVLLNAEDERCTRELKDVISSYVFSAKVDCTENNIIVHSDRSYVYYLMLQYFHPHELHNDHGTDRRKISPAYLEEGHPLISDADRLYNLKIVSNHGMKRCIEPSTPMPYGYGALHQKVVFELHPSSLSFPWEELLRQETSYACCTFKYSGNMLAIAKATSRIVRMGFKIVGWKFPMFRHKAYWLNVVFSRADAIVMMGRIVAELETSYPHLELSAPITFLENLNFIKTYFRVEEYGGIHDISYSTLINETYFTQDAVVRSRASRVIEWHPTHEAVYNYGLGFMTDSTRRATFNSTTENLQEVTVLILPNPLISAIYMGKQLPRRCVFPELWQCFESMSYKTLASKMTSLNEKEANEIIQHFGLETSKKDRMKSFMTRVDEPFIAIILMGSCIQSNFWLDMERYFSREQDEIEILKKHLWVASSKRQVEYLTTALFDQVLPNGKIEIRTSMI